MSDFNICGVLVHAQLERVDQIKSQLEEIPGVEVHSATDEGKLVVTVESESRRFVADTITGFTNVNGVLSASMIYQHSEDLATEGEMSA